MASGIINRYLVRDDFHSTHVLAEFMGNTSTSVDLIYPASNYLFLSLMLYDNNNNVVGVFTTMPTYFRNLTYKVFGESSSQWGSMLLDADMDKATFNRTTANTSKVRLVGICNF